MTIKKYDIEVDCRHCICSASDTNNSFEVTVPVCDVKTGNCKNAILFCAISLNQHKVEFKGWQDPADNSERLPEELNARLNDLLAFIEDHKTCGNENICPADVVQIVKRLSAH